MELTAKVHHEDGMFWAEVNELPGCFASGETPAELIETLDEAVSLYLSPPPSGGGKQHPTIRAGAVIGGSLSHLGMTIPDDIVAKTHEYELEG